MFRRMCAACCDACLIVLFVSCVLLGVVSCCFSSPPHLFGAGAVGGVVLLWGVMCGSWLGVLYVVFGVLWFVYCVFCVVCRVLLCVVYMSVMCVVYDV